MKKLAALALILTLFCACAKDNEPTANTCQDIDLGLVQLHHDFLQRFPYTGVQLAVFKNTATGAEKLFGRVDSMVYTTPFHGTYKCGSGQVNHRMTFEQENRIVSFKSSDGYTFNVQARPVWDGAGTDETALYDQVSCSFYAPNGAITLKFPFSLRGNETQVKLDSSKLEYSYAYALDLAGKTFQQVYVTGDATIPKLVWSYKQGLVAFETQGQTWVLDHMEDWGLTFELLYPNTDGIPISLYASLNKLTLIDFWASWCLPCRNEIRKVLKPLYAEYHDKGLEIFSVSVDSQMDRWKQAIVEDDMTWINVGKASFNTPGYQFNGIPATFLVDQNKRLVATGLRGTALEKFVKNYLK